MYVNAARTPGPATARPRAMSTGKVRRLLLAAFGVAIAVGPCTFQATTAVEEPIMGDFISPEVGWIFDEWAPT